MKYSAADLRECLHCGYALNGLPDVHVCPECGKAYDLSIPVWRRSKPRAYLAGAVGFVVIFSYFKGAASLAELKRVMNPSAALALYAVAAAAIIGIGLVLHFRQGWRTNLVALVDEGVLVRTGKRVEMLAYGDIAPECVTWLKRTSLRRKGQLSEVRIDDHFDTRSELRNFQRTLKKTIDARQAAER